MTEMEAAKILTVICECWPRFSEGRDIRSTARLWQRMFANDEYAQVEAALTAYIATDTKGFAPSIGALKERLAQMRMGGESSGLEAWMLVKAALRNGLYGYEREFARLPEDVRAAVGDARVLRDWAMMDETTVDSVVMSNFMRGYRARAGHVREMQKLPEDVRAMFAAVGEAMRLPAAKDGEKPAARPLPEAIAGEPDDGYAPLPVRAKREGDAPEPWALARKRFEATMLRLEREQQEAQSRGLPGVTGRSERRNAD